MDFIIGQTNNNNPRGTYHEYMDFVHTYWNIPINDENIPQYSILKEKDKNIYENINPKRKEYFIAWWIKNKIENDVFLKDGFTFKKSDHIKEQYKTLQLLDSKGYFATFGFGFIHTVEVIKKYMSL